MMWKTNRYAYASALPAIAAALALSSTPSWSQEVQPAAESDPISIAPPAPTSVEPATDAAASAESAPVAEATPVSKPTPKTISAKSTHTVTKKPAEARTSRAAPAQVEPSKPAEAVQAPPPQPVVDTRSLAIEQAAAAPEPRKTALSVDEDAIMLGGGALALLALGGGAVAFARRRRDEDEQFVDQTAVHEPTTDKPEPRPRHDPIYDEQPAIVAPSAFAWGNPQPAESKVERRHGETWVERAYRGPTPENPSLSLRKRLKRANFFDARERRVAAGKAEPIDADAGLPERVASERELELA